MMCTAAHHPVFGTQKMQKSRTDFCRNRKTSFFCRNQGKTFCRQSFCSEESTPCVPTSALSHKMSLWNKLFNLNIVSWRFSIFFIMIGGCLDLDMNLTRYGVQIKGYSLIGNFQNMYFYIAPKLFMKMDNWWLKQIRHLVPNKNLDFLLLFQNPWAIFKAVDIPLPRGHSPKSKIIFFGNW